MISNKPLPAGWCEAPLPQVANVNPAHPIEVPGDETVVSFVPMASVETLSGRLDPSNRRPWHEVKKGYTRFQDGDVLFAKITPCMENGKAALASGLSSGVGAGSTEFHILRPGPAVRPELLLHYVLQEEFRKSARAQMTGTAGQLRVPSRFLDEQTIPVPPLPEQHRIVEAIESYFTRLDDAVATLERVQRNLKRYRASVLKAAVEGRLVPTEAELARLPAPRPGVYFAYALQCDGGSVSIGQTSDLRQRWHEHLSGNASEWTRRHRPLCVAHYEEFGSREEAVRAEKEWKTGFGRKRLKRLISSGRAPARAAAGGRQAGYEPASVLLERILAERRRRWEEAELAKMKAKGKTPKDDKWKAKYKEPVVPDTEDLPALPEGWCWTSVDQLAAHESNSLTDGPFGSNLKSSHYTSSGPRVIRLQNIGDGVFLDSEAHVSPRHFAGLRKHSVQPGDVVIASLGTGLPRACVVPDWLGPAMVKADCLRFAPHRDLIRPWFAVHALNALPSRKRAEDLVHGVGRPRIGLTFLRPFPLPLPPLPEQGRILEEVERLLSLGDATTIAASRNTSRCATLRQSILKWAFEGRLADQDPTDEPASQLLERIQAEREARPAQPARTRRRARATKTERT